MSSGREIDLNLPATVAPDKGKKPMLDIDLNVPAMSQEDEGLSSSEKQAAASESPPKYPIVICAICQDTVIEETQTSCGHVFCKDCIRTALKANRKCPTCKQRQCIKDLRRIYLSFNRL